MGRSLVLAMNNFEINFEKFLADRRKIKMRL